MSEPPTLPIFICYRQDDGREIAQWLYDNLHNERLLFTGDSGEIALDVYFDQTAAAVGDWTRLHKPALQRARAFLLVCTAGAKVNLGPEDWVHREFGWWLENRNTAPIIIDPYDKGDRWIPDAIKARWPQPQRVLVQPDKWEQMPEQERRPLQQNARDRLIGGLRESQQATNFEDLERERERSRLLAKQRAYLIGVLGICVALIMGAGALYWKAKINEELAIISQESASVAASEAKTSLDRMIEQLVLQLQSTDGTLALSALDLLGQQIGRGEALTRIGSESLQSNEWVASFAYALDEKKSGADPDGWEREIRAVLPKLMSEARGIPPPPSVRVNRGITITGGRFRMGSENRRDEGPVHFVNLSAFQIQEHEVTNEQYRRFESRHDSGAPAHDYSAPANHPVVNVRWFDAMAYAAWLGGSLPTEAQWEFTARGTEGRTYPWGEEPPDCERSNYTDCGTGGLLPVKTGREKGRTPEGVYDLAGNAWEWCRDWEAKYPVSELIDPMGRSFGNVRVLRGGSFEDDASELRGAERDYSGPTNYYPRGGFRVAWSNPNLD